MEIVLEYVLLDNFLIDVLLLVLTNKTIKCPNNKLGLVLAGMFGAGFAVVSPLIRIGGVMAVGLKLLVAFIIVWISNLNFKKYLLRYALFVGYTFLFGGAIIAIFNFLGISVYDSMYIGYVSSLPLGSILVSIMLFFIFMFRLITSLIKAKFYSDLSCTILITINNKTQKIKGFIDTGNTLHTSLGRPVVIVSENILNKWFTVQERMDIMLGNIKNLNLQNFEVLTVSSMGANYKMKVFDCTANIKDKNYKIALGVSNRRLGLGDCQAILGKEIMEV